MIVVFICDFLCIHPFNDGNGRMSRLLTILLLYKCGYYVGKYISLDAKRSKLKDLYYETLFESQKDWHAGNDGPSPFISYLLWIIAMAYQDFENRAKLIIKKYLRMKWSRMLLNKD